jgi:3-mercaptopropionate dioxygenase
MTHPAFATLQPRLDEAVSARDVADVANRVKEALQETLRGDELPLPASFTTPRPDTYARRLLHRDAGGRYTVIVMTWGPGQGTALHDHAGIWCVECVVDGEMEVTQYDLLSEQEGAFRFARQQTVKASRGSAGCLIPPFEYHTLANAYDDRSSVTLHVYGGEMDHCHAFEPMGIDAYRRIRRTLTYHAIS